VLAAVVQTKASSTSISRPCAAAVRPREDPGQFVNRAADPAYAARSPILVQDARLAAASPIDSHRYRATPNGLECARVGMTA